MRNISFKNTSSDTVSGDAVSTVLTITVIVGSVLLLLAVMAGPAPVRADMRAAQVAKPAIDEVVVTATRPKHVL